jgi:hypothetical protein
MAIQPTRILNRINLINESPSTHVIVESAKQFDSGLRRRCRTGFPGDPNGDSCDVIIQLFQ